MKTFNIAYSAGADVAALVATLSTQGTVLYNLENIRVIGLQVSEEASSSTFENTPGVVLVELDSGTTVTSHAEWHQKRLVTPSLPLRATYNPISLGDDVIVYLVDSGVDITHAELVGSSITHLYSYDGVMTDIQGHGTSMASVINGQTLGVSKNAIVKSVKIPFGDVTIGQLLLAFDAILSDHAATPGVKVVNCSWSVPKSQLLDSKITELQNAGLVVVAAAGNTRVAADTLSPVGLNTVLGVAASDVYDRVISWGVGLSSNFGPEVDITAPGIDVPVAFISGGYTESSGTSISAAIVSGVVAQYIAENTAKSALEIQELVIASAFEDMLFRNESIYGTTPNRLIKAIYLGSRTIWDVDAGTLFLAQKNVSTNIELQTTFPLATAIYGDSTPYDGERVSGQLFFKKLDWITSEYADGVLTLTVTPDADIEPGKYTIYITSTDTNDVNYYTRYSVGVFASSPTELDAVEIEKYFTVDENSDTVVRVTPAVCYYHSDCGKGAFCCGGNCC